MFYRFKGVQKNLGDVYCILAELRNPKMNLDKAIEAYEESLKLRTLKTIQEIVQRYRRVLGMHTLLLPVQRIM